MKKKIIEKDEFKKKGCDFINPASCEEELDEDGLDKDEEEKEHFEEDDDSFE
jgi:hypothetical protein